MSIYTMYYIYSIIIYTENDKCVYVIKAQNLQLFIQSHKEIILKFNFLGCEKSFFGCSLSRIHTIV